MMHGQKNIEKAKLFVYLDGLHFPCYSSDLFLNQVTC